MRLSQEKSESSGRRFPLKLLCQVVGVPRSSFYEYQRAQRQARRERKKRGPKMQADDKRLL